MSEALENVPKKSLAHMRAAILALEQAMLEMKEHHIECETIHHFAGGVYSRELRIPRGATVTGKIHKTEHLNVLVQGEITVWTEEGMKRLKAPYTLVSKPGTKRVGFAHEDTIWMTFHATELRDIDQIEALLIAKDFSEVPEIDHQTKEPVCLT